MRGPIAIAVVCVLLAVGVAGTAYWMMAPDVEWGEPYARPLFTLETPDEPRIRPGPPVAEEELGGPRMLPAENPYTGNAHAIADGYRLYQWMNCDGCHGQGGGSIGPPLWDQAWIYGGAPAQIAESILRGRPEGMPAFADRLTEDQVWRVVAYLQSLAPGGSLTRAGER